MSINFQKKTQAKKMNFNVEVFNSAGEVVDVSARRKITNSSFHDFDNGYMPGREWCGNFRTFEEVKTAMREGYQPTVDKLKGAFKANLAGQAKRISFFNDVVGFAPIVPLALMGIPEAMQNSYMKPIKAKVIDVYYDMTCSWSVDSDDIIKAGQTLLGAILELEMQGYKFNLYATQSYSGDGDCDMLCTKIKSSNTPLDLKRMSFPLTHTAYFRVIGFDWYSKFPIGKYRSCYGHSIAYDKSQEEITKEFQRLFGKGAMFFTATTLVKKGDKADEYLKGTAPESEKQLVPCIAITADNVENLSAFVFTE